MKLSSGSSCQDVCPDKLSGKVLQNVGATYIWWKPSRVVEEGGFEISSIYEDFTISIDQVLWIFMGQLVLVFFYINSILKLGDINSDTCSYGFCIAAFVSVQMSAMFNRGSESQLGQIWKPSLFSYIIAHRTELEFQIPKFPTGMQKVDIPAYELWLRQFMGFMVNQVIRDVIGYTVPLLLMQSEVPLFFLFFVVRIGNSIFLLSVIRQIISQTIVFLISERPATTNKRKQVGGTIGLRNECASRHLHSAAR